MPSIERRAFCTGLASTFATFSARGAAPRRSPALPHVVYVLCDDLGWGDLQCYNPLSADPTPFANRLAAEGMRWTNMHSSDAVCTPSRYSILTGRYCWRTSLKKDVLMGDSPSLIETGRMTVPSMLKARGYYTAGVGKWHLGLGSQLHADFTEPFHPCPTDLGFDYYFGIPASLDMPPYVYFENDRVVEQATSSTPGNKDRGAFWRAGEMAPHFDIRQALTVMTNRAAQIITQHASSRSQPLFLYLALPSPHTPWLPLPQYQGKSRAGAYGDYVAETDGMVGLVLSALESAGMDGDTLVIFTSDHGADWRLQDQAQYEHRANADWRGQKADIWEGGVRIPFLARWPGKIRSGTVTDQLGCLVDLMATAAAITRARLPDDAAEDSFNLLPVLLGQSGRPVRDSIVGHAWDGMFSITLDNWKLGLGLGSGGWSSKPERIDPAPGGPMGQLYNLTDDPREEHNLFQEHPEIVDRLTRLLNRIQEQGYSRPM